MILLNLHKFGTAILLALIFFLTPGAQAQTGTISGFITDPSGAAVPGAKVTAALVRRNVARTMITDDLGGYLFPAMPPGAYRL